MYCQIQLLLLNFEKKKYDQIKLASVQFEAIMGDDILARINDLLSETIKVLFEQRCHPYFSLVPAHLVGNSKFSESMPVRCQLLGIWSEFQKTPGI